MVTYEYSDSGPKVLTVPMSNLAHSHIVDELWVVQLERDGDFSLVRRSGCHRLCDHDFTSRQTSLGYKLECACVDVELYTFDTRTLGRGPIRALSQGNLIRNGYVSTVLFMKERSMAVEKRFK